MFKGFIPHSMPYGLHRCENCDTKLSKSEFENNKFDDGSALCHECYEQLLRSMIF